MVCFGLHYIASMIAFSVPLGRIAAEAAQKVDAELIAAQGKPMDVGGYYRPDFKKASAAMRPSGTLNAIIDAM